MTTLTYFDFCSGGSNNCTALHTIATPANETAAKVTVNGHNERDITDAISSYFAKISEMKQYTVHHVVIETNYLGQVGAEFFGRRVKTAFPSAQIIYFEATRKSKITLAADGSLTIKT